MKIIHQLRKSLLLSLALSIGIFCQAASWEPTINKVSWKGNVKRLILLVETKERPFYTPNANYEYDQMLNGANYTGLGCVGSARQFLIDNSGGKFKPQFIVVGPLTLSKSMGYYGGKPLPNEDNDGDVGKMVIEACKLAKQQGINFSEFDYNNDNLVDNVYLFHSGPVDTSIPTPWPHASGVAGGGLVYDGKLIDSYAVSQEMASETKRGGYTTFLHEFGHTLGLPDDYSGRLGKFSIYCNGTFDGGIIPVNFNAAERLILGWLDYQVIDQDGEYTLEALASNKVLMLKTNNPDEYFLFENRSNSKSITPWDSYFEYGGMLIWHIDRSNNTVKWTDDNGIQSSSAMGMWARNAPNGAPSHPCHELIEADNTNNPSAYRAGMYFPGNRHETTLNSTTHPEFKTWAGLPAGIEISGIKQQANGNITFTVKNTNTSSLSVTIKNSEGKLMTNTYVSLTPVHKVAAKSKMLGKGLMTSGQKLIGNTGLTGNCVFTNVMTGKYQVLADKDGYVVYTGYVDITNGDNSTQITLQSHDEISGTKLKWHADNDFGAIFFVPGQIRSAGWDSNDLSPYVGQRLDKVNIQLGGQGNTGDLYIFIDDKVVYCKPMENITLNGVTTVDLSKENIIIEEGKTLKTGYHLKTGAEWPSTVTRPQTPNKGGLIYSLSAKKWEMANDLNVNWVISIVLRDPIDVNVESIEFDEPKMEMLVGDNISLHANVKPINVSNRKVTWSSSEPTIVSVDATGKLQANAIGTAIITAKSVFNPKIEGTCIVHVNMNGEMVNVQTFQREIRLKWPGYNPNCKWKVSWRKKGETKYESAPLQTDTLLYIKRLNPDTGYDGILEVPSDETFSQSTFSFYTKPISSKYTVINVSKKRITIGTVVPLIISNLIEDKYTIVWKLNGTTLEEPEYKFDKIGTFELRSEITYSDGSIEILIKNIEIIK